MTFATVFDNLLKRPLDRFAWHRDILQRYEDGRLTIHMHCTTLQGDAI